MFQNLKKKKKDENQDIEIKYILPLLFKGSAASWTEDVGGFEFLAGDRSTLSCPGWTSNSGAEAEASGGGGGVSPVEMGTEKDADFGVEHKNDDVGPTFEIIDIDIDNWEFPSHIS